MRVSIKKPFMFVLTCLVMSTALADAFVYLPSTPAQGSGSVSVGQLTVMNADTGLEVETIELDETPSAVAISHDGSLVFVADSGADTVSLIDTSDLQLAAKLSDVGADPMGLAVSADDRWLLVGSSDGIAVVDLTVTPLSSQLSTVSYSGTSLSLSPDGRYAVSLDSGTVTGSLGVSLLNLTANDALEVGAELDSLMLNDFTVRDVQGGYGMVVGEDGRIYIANTGRDEVVVLQIDANTHSLQQLDSISLPDGSAPYDVALSTDGRYLLVSLFTPDFMVSGAVNAYAVQDLSTSASLPLAGSAQWPTYHPQGIALTPDGRFALVKSQWGTVPASVATSLSLAEDATTGEVSISEGLSLALSGRDVNAVGDFFGPDCPGCLGSRDHSAATTAVDENGNASAGALQPLTGLLLAGFLVICRRRLNVAKF